MTVEAPKRPNDRFDQWLGRCIWILFPIALVSLVVYRGSPASINERFVVWTQNSEWAAATTTSTVSGNSAEPVKLFPPLSELVGRIRNIDDQGRAKPGTTACFWTGFEVKDEPLYQQMLGWLQDFGISNYYFEFWSHQPVNKSWYQEQFANVVAYENGLQTMTPQNHQPVHTHFGLSPTKFFLYCYWQALATASMDPVAILFAPENSIVNETSIWDIIEFPALTNNPYVERIYRADPSIPPSGRMSPTMTDVHSPVLLWRRGKDTAVPQSHPVFDCGAAGLE